MSCRAPTSWISHTMPKCLSWQAEIRYCVVLGSSALYASLKLLQMGCLWSSRSTLIF